MPVAARPPRRPATTIEGVRTPACVAAALVMVLVCTTVVGTAQPARGGEGPARLAGADRYATAAEVASATSADPSRVYVATGGDWPDAVAAAAAAVSADAPVVLTRRDRLPEATAQVLAAFGDVDVVVVGGPAAVGVEVVRGLQDLVGTARVQRVAGADRFATATALAADVGPSTGGTVLIATAADYPDALSGATLAVDDPAPLVLTEPSRLPRATADFLRGRRPGQVLVLGGRSAVSDAVVEQIGGVVGQQRVRRIEGQDRYATAAAVADEAFPAGGDGAASGALLASGLDFPDALAAAPAAAATGAPLLLTRTDCQPAATRDALDARGVAPGAVTLVGGVAAVRTPAALPVTCGPVDASVVVDDLDAPWDVVATDDAAYLSLRDTGRILRLAPDGSTAVIATLEVDAAGEGGLLGLAMDPRDGSRLYAYRTTTAGNEVVRVELDDPGGAPTVVLDGIPSGRIHNGGRIAFGPDSMLYVTTGDAGVPALAADAGSLGGKILRVTADGDAPDDNPAPGSPVWSSGHRNVQGLAWLDGQLYASEFGPDRDDEINRIVPGGDYGWPAVTGVAGRAGLRDPLVVRQPPVASWSGMASVVDSQVADLEGHLAVAALRGQRLWAVDVGPDGAAAGDLLVSAYGRLRQVVRAPDGAVWLLTNNTDGRGRPGPDDDRIVRIGHPRADGRWW